MTSQWNKLSFYRDGVSLGEAIHSAVLDGRVAGRQRTVLGGLRSPVFWGQIRPVGIIQTAQMLTLCPTQRR